MTKPHSAVTISGWVGMSNRVDVLDRIDADLAAAAAVIPRLPRTAGER
jgi:hypothetical protein